MWLCGKHAIGPDHERLITDTGADLVVCLCESEELVDRYPGYVAWLTAEDGDEGHAMWFPIPDLHAPPLDRVRPLLDRLRTVVGSGHGVLIHCGAGFGRTGTIAAALLMQMGVSHDDALASVARARPMAGPEVGAQTLLLEELASELPRR